MGFAVYAVPGCGSNASTAEDSPGAGEAPGSWLTWPAMEVRLDDKVAIVTGGSRGIGKSIADVFVKAGAQVMITSRSEESCAAAAAEIGEGVHYEAGHIGRDADAERVIEATMDRLGRIDVLVNNAATNPYAGPAIEVDRARWDKTFEINLTAPMFWTQRVWRRFMKENVDVCERLADAVYAAKGLKRQVPVEAVAETPVEAPTEPTDG